MRRGRGGGRKKPQSAVPEQEIPAGDAPKAWPTFSPPGRHPLSLPQHEAPERGGLCSDPPPRLPSTRPPLSERCLKKTRVGEDKRIPFLLSFPSLPPNEPAAPPALHPPAAVRKARPSPAGPLQGGPRRTKRLCAARTSRPRRALRPASLSPSSPRVSPSPSPQTHGAAQAHEERRGEERRSRGGRRYRALAVVSATAATTTRLSRRSGAAATAM